MCPRIDVKARVSGLFVLMLLVSAGNAYGFFEHAEYGARPVGMGKAYTAVPGDVLSILWNPAGLGFLDTKEIYLSGSRPYMVENLSSGFAGFGMPLGTLSCGLGWSHTGVTGLVGEDEFILSLSTAPLGDKVTVGGNVKLMRVGLNPSVANSPMVTASSETRPSADVGVLCRYNRKLLFGASFHDILEPSFDFVSDPLGAATKVERSERYGVSCMWHPSSTVSADGEHTRGTWTLNLGGELWFYDVFAVRTGISRGELAGGIGIKGQGWEASTSFLTHRLLGNSYIFSFRVFK
ncbi:MAG: hypothetical protein QME66_01100 [Candidatus Eisenbacteria bacterium]|nr:hypothetical protein [Candidatus Eisenbacteria bacterium]